MGSDTQGGRPVGRPRREGTDVMNGATYWKIVRIQRASDNPQVWFEAEFPEEYDTYQKARAAKELKEYYCHGAGFEFKVRQFDF